MVPIIIFDNPYIDFVADFLLEQFIWPFWKNELLSRESILILCSCFNSKLKLLILWPVTNQFPNPMLWEVLATWFNTDFILWYFKWKIPHFFLIILQVSVTYSCYTNLSWLLPVIGEKVNGHTTHHYLTNSTEGGYTTDDGIFTL